MEKKYFAEIDINECFDNVYCEIVICCVQDFVLLIVILWYLLS